MAVTRFPRNLNQIKPRRILRGLKDYNYVIYEVERLPPRFKRNLRIVYLVKQVGKKIHSALLTDLKLAVKNLYRFKA